MYIVCVCVCHCVIQNTTSRQYYVGQINDKMLYENNESKPPIIIIGTKIVIYTL